MLKASSQSVHLLFNPTDTESYQKLSKSMSNNFVGCIQMNVQMNAIRIFIIHYTDKKFVGLIPNDQESFFAALKQAIEMHKAKNLTNQKMVSSKKVFFSFYFVKFILKPFFCLFFL